MKRNVKQVLAIRLLMLVAVFLISIALVRADVIVQAGTIDVDSKLYVDPSTGNVGIGAIPPSQKLDVLGAARLQPVAQPATLADGVIYYDSGANKFKCYEGSTLKDCISSSSGGSLPAGTFGQTLWHDGNNWVASSLLNNTNVDMIKIQKNNEVHLSLRNIEDGGRDWALVSAGSAGGIGKGNFSIYDKTLGISRLVINDNGNVGIGTTDPGYKLDVFGTGRFDDLLSFTSAGAARGYIYGHAAATTLGFGTDRDRMLLTNANDGLKVYDPSTSLKYAGLGHDSTNAIITSGTGDVTISPAGTSNPFVVKENSGRVGIGINNPGSLLQIHGSGGNTEGIRLTSSGANNPSAYLFPGTATPDSGFLTFGDGSGWKFHIGKSSDSGATKFVTIQDNGYVGIGNPIPSVKLDVNGVVIAACPSDMTNTGTVCIENNERASATWFNAIDACGDAGRRLCSVSEWYYACFNFPSLQLMTDNFEWTDDRTRGAATQGVYTLGSTQCDNSQVTQDSNTVAFRCCIDRKLSS